MTYRMFFCCVFLVFSISLCAQNHALPGQTFQRAGSDRLFVEEDIEQFRVEISHHLFQELIDKFQADATYDESYSIAGFSFIPIMEEQAGSTGSEYHFITNGFRVVLTLWKQVHENRRPQPSQFVLYGFDESKELMDAMNPEFEANRTNRKGYFEVKKGNTPQGTSLSTRRYATELIPVLAKTREFDVVFLDFPTYRAFATGTQWYPNGRRSKTGIVLERMLTSLPDAENGKETFYRSLVFRPLSVPEVGTGAVNRSAVAFSYAPHCPPYWIHLDR